MSKLSEDCEAKTIQEFRRDFQGGECGWSQTDIGYIYCITWVKPLLNQRQQYKHVDEKGLVAWWAKVFFSENKLSMEFKVPES